MKINLNQMATFKLSELGRKIWRKHCADERFLFPTNPPTGQTGEETEIALQLWVFISIFGTANWNMGGPYVLETMEVELEPDQRQHIEIRFPNAEEQRAYEKTLADLEAGTARIVNVTPCES